ncbi:MAG: hypothetical protein IPP48_04115 [Chitinophagaceae bacterium]|nr:hypothetical protein [Chitinophagaceae bacterium]
MKKNVTIYLLLIFTLINKYNYAQSPTVKTFIDKTNILIGEQIKYKVIATYSSNTYNVHWINTADSVAHFEIVEKSKIDTATQNNNIVVQQTITFTSFDSGKWNTPAYRINFDPLQDDTTINLFTDSIAVNVGYAPADTTNQLRDIKPIMEADDKNYFWYYIIGAFFLLLVVLVLVLRKVTKQKNKTPSAEFTARHSPYDEAVQNLNNLKKLNLDNVENTKQYHFELAKILKWYVSRIQRKSIMNKTTDDLLIHLSQNKVSKDMVTDIANALRCGDAVKFAKYLPETTQSEECLTKIKDAITYLHTNKLING